MSYSQTVCSPYRHFPFPYAETGTIAPLINGSNTGYFNYTVVYSNRYLTMFPRPTNAILGIKTFKSREFLMIASRPSTFVDFMLGSGYYTYTSMAIEMTIAAGYQIQYIQINYLVDTGSMGVSCGSFGFYVPFY